jgi:FKBP-type peptidyl-prolyl cis-trans isomerase 2
MSNEGKKVSVHYTGTLDDGTKFDSSYDHGQPLDFTCGAGQMIPGFDEAVKTMEVGEKRIVHLEPAEAYGESNPDAIQSVEIAQLPGSEGLTVGQQVMLQGPGGYPMRAVVVDKTDTMITFDMNHELAGKALNFEIELLSAE